MVTIHDNIEMVCIRLEAYTYVFLSAIIDCPFYAENFFSQSSFSLSSICCLSTTVNVSFSGEVIGVVIQHDSVPILISA